MWSRRPDRRRDAARGRGSERIEERLRAAERNLARGRPSSCARQAFELAAESAGDLGRLNRIGDLLVRADHVERGVELFERVGRAYAEDGFWAKAIAIYRKILRYDPWRTDIQTQLAFLYQRSGLPTGAGAPS